MNKKTAPYVIARCRDAGVHAGELVSRDTEGFVVLRNARRIWSWKGASTLSEIAVHGCKSTGDSCVASTIDVQELRVSDVCELIHCKPAGRNWIESQPEWRA